MATIYFFKDKNILTKKIKANPKPIYFRIESPNGAGSYEIDLKELDKSNFINGKGKRSKSFTKYTITLRFDYSSHYMNLQTLLRADYCIIPFSFGLGDDVNTEFVLKNRSAVHNFFMDMAIVANPSLTSDKFPSGNVQLEFESVDTYTSNEIKTMAYYKEKYGYRTEIIDGSNGESLGYLVINNESDDYYELSSSDDLIFIGDEVENINIFGTDYPIEVSILEN